MCLTPVSLGRGDRAGPHSHGHLGAAGFVPCQCRVLGAASFPGEIASAQRSEMRHNPCACSTGEVPVLTLGMAVLPWKASDWYLRVERWGIHPHYQPVLGKHSRAHTKTVSLQ